jgi:hypothetical protein
MGALVSILEQEKVDIAALQEATPKHLEQLHAHPYTRFVVDPLFGRLGIWLDIESSHHITPGGTSP